MSDSRLANLFLPRSNLSARQVSDGERRRRANAWPAKEHLYLLAWASNYTKWTPRESGASEERELALDWIRSQGGEKHGRHGEGERRGRLLFSVQSTLKAGTSEGRKRGGGRQQRERKKTYAFVSAPSPSLLVIIFHDKGQHFSHLRRSREAR